ncbi:hypothetical protein J2Y69_002553 [Microbacterium resistens]|uniref:DUF2868 domain-containing protein n=1 Tax=Microbacterium resistens TaxID=156977 RepID=A0ABU1SED2_9MICO|nr:hypothetical protein [Microbacterium resistens]MDR6867945.1 hypothetical protein [Microbacterium resistens]
MSIPRFDTAALQGPIDAEAAHAEAQAHVREILGEHGSSSRTARTVFRLTVLIVGFGVLSSLFVVAVQLFFGGWSANVFTWLIAAIMVIPLAVFQIRAEIRTRRDEEESWYRLARFAAANSMAYAPYQADAELPPALFRRGGSRALRDSLSRPGIQTANYGYEKMTARTRMPHTACFVAFDAPAGISAMTLITRLGDVWGQPVVPPTSQRRQEIDAELDAHIGVYCDPRDGENVRRILGPDVREALLRLASHCDIEIVGDRVSIIARRRLAMTDTAFWRWVEDLAVLVDVVLSRSMTIDDATRSGWEQRSAERTALFTPSPWGRAFLAVVLIPAVFGTIAAAVTAQWG